MNTTLYLTLALLSAGAPVPKDIAPVGPAPYALRYLPGPDGVIWIYRDSPVAIQAMGDGTDSILSLGLVSSELADLKDLTIYTVDGQEVSLKDAAKKLAAGAPVVASSDGKKVDPEKRRNLKAPDTLIFVAPELVKDRPNGTPTLIPDVSYVEPLLPAIPVGK